MKVDLSVNVEEDMLRRMQTLKCIRCVKVDVDAMSERSIKSQTTEAVMLCSWCGSVLD